MEQEMSKFASEFRRFAKNACIYGKTCFQSKREMAFNSAWYKKNYAVPFGQNAFAHYLKEGMKRHYCANAYFSPFRYLMANPDVRQAGIDPFLHAVKFGSKEHRESVAMQDAAQMPEAQYQEACRVQDERMAAQFDPKTKKLIVYLEPYIPQINGGIMCITNYCCDIRGMPEIDGAVTLLATAPSAHNTFADYTMFDARDHVYRFTQLSAYFTEVESLILHIPDCEIYRFLVNVQPEQIAWLQGIPDLQINLLDQNNELMPPPKTCDLLRFLTDNITMTCAHAAYANTSQRSSYGVPVHFIPANKNVKYHIYPFEQKENLLVLSPDQHPGREGIIGKILENFPELRVVEIQNMAFSDYLDLIGRAKWVFSFGEGYDGYTIESLLSNTISFTLFNDVFFAPGFVPWPNMFESASQMSEQIVDMMKRLSDRESYMAFLEKTKAACFSSYVGVDYLDCLRRFYARQYDLPFEPVQQEREARMKRKPLVSVLLTTSGNEDCLRNTLQSILLQSYEPIELLIYDRGSAGETGKTLDEYAERASVRIIRGEKVKKNKAFEELVQLALGEYIAIAEPGDQWERDKIAFLLEHIDRQAFCYGDVEGGDGRMEICWREKRAKIPSVRGCIHPNRTVPACGLMITKEAAVQALPYSTDELPVGWWIVLHTLLFGGCGHYADGIVARVGADALKPIQNESIAKAMADILHRHHERLSPENEREISFCMNNARLMEVLGHFFHAGVCEMFEQSDALFTHKRLEDLKQEIQKMLELTGQE